MSEEQNLAFEEFVKFADSVGFNLENPTPVESLAFQTVALIKLSPIKDFALKCNELSMFDTIIFTLFIIRMQCITNIDNRKNAELFDNDYISKVFEYFPESHSITKQYDSEYFNERVKYYDSIIADNSYPFDKRMTMLIESFEEIIKYDYTGEYVRFNQNTPMILLGIDKQFKISADVKMFYNSLPDFFNSLLPDIFEFYNNDEEDNQDPIDSLMKAYNNGKAYISWRDDNDTVREMYEFAKKEKEEQLKKAEEIIKDQIRKNLTSPRYKAEVSTFTMSSQSRNNIEKSIHRKIDQNFEVRKQELIRQQDLKEFNSCLLEFLFPFLIIGLFVLIVACLC